MFIREESTCWSQREPNQEKWIHQQELELHWERVLVEHKEGGKKRETSMVKDKSEFHLQVLTEERTCECKLQNTAIEREQPEKPVRM